MTFVYCLWVVLNAFINKCEWSNFMDIIINVLFLVHMLKIYSFSDHAQVIYLVKPFNEVYIQIYLRMCVCAILYFPA